MVNLMPWRNRGGDGGTTMMRLRSEVDRLFDRFFDTPFGGTDLSTSITGWMPSLDISDKANELVICAEVPGMNPDDIEVSVTGNMLTISGEKREETEKTEGGVFHSERRFGLFRRSVELPHEVDADNISADYSNGVLTLKIPKSSAQQPRKIQVKGKSHSQSGQQSKSERTSSGRSKAGRSETIDDAMAL